MDFPNIDPVIFQIGPLAIRWYALAYVAGILLGWWYMSYIDRKREPHIFSQKEALDNIIIWAILGIIIGGRLGHVLFYGWDYYIQHPIEIIMLWHGGMAFHGGLIGVIVAMYLFSRHYKLPFLCVMDSVACVVPIGLFFGRIANFINGELYGRVTDVAWAVKFPHGGFLPRHPSQLYEAMLEGVLLFLILWFIAWHSKARQQPGLLSGVFLIGYATFRMIAELFREPDGIVFASITKGQAFSLPMILIGVFIAYRAMHTRIDAKL